METDPQCLLQSCSTMLAGTCSWDAYCWIYWGCMYKVKDDGMERYSLLRLIHVLILTFSLEFSVLMQRLWTGVKCTQCGGAFNLAEDAFGSN